MTSNQREAGARVPFWRGHFLPQMLFFCVGMPRGSFGSVDVTRRCNLRCKHCYYYDNGKNSDQGYESTPEEWYAYLLSVKKQKKLFHSCTWVGGEPLLRRSVIEKCRHLFQHNLIVTNGTIPLPDWRDCYFHISIDGTEQFYEELRGKKGIYQQIKENVRQHPQLHMSIVYCITTLNHACIEETLLEWKRETPARGFMFDFYTPMHAGDDPLWVDWDLRESICERLIKLKEEHGDFIRVPAEVFELMKKKHARAVTSSCLLRERGFAMTADQQYKEKCILGKEADCSRCGCIVPYYLQVRTDRKYMLKMTWNEVKDRLFPSARASKGDMVPEIR